MDWGLFLTYLAACGAAATTGAVFQPGDWYRNLAKPSWTPPDWVFPVTWTVLYLSMSVAAARVAAMEGAGQALAFWSVQIAFNTLWTPVFFGLRRMRASLVPMAGLWLSVTATCIVFFTLDLWAGLMFVPYVAWVSVAAALNLALVRLNPEAGRPTSAS